MGRRSKYKVGDKVRFSPEHQVHGEYFEICVIIEAEKHGDCYFYDVEDSNGDIWVCTNEDLVSLTELEEILYG